MKLLLRIAIPLVLLIAGYVTMISLEKAEEKPSSGRPTTRTLPLAEVIDLSLQNFQVKLTAQGVTRPRNATALTPRVAGRVLVINENFDVGAFFKKGDVLLKLDPADFEAALAGAEAQLARSEAAIAQEVARAEQAELEWQDLGYTTEAPDLVLRKPQMKEAEANVKAATAQLLKAQRDLERTQVLAPYDGCVRTRLIGLGQSVGSSTTLGDIFSTDSAEVRLPLSAEDLPFIDLPEGNHTDTLEAILTDALSTTTQHTWSARIIRPEGVLDETSRELFVIARVEDPYGLKSNHPPLRVGQPVQAVITGKILEGVHVIPRSSLRSPTEVTLVDPETSTIHRTEITPIWSNKTEIVVEDNLPAGWLLVVSRLPVAADGSPVKIVRKGEAPKAAQRPDQESEA